MITFRREKLDDCYQDVNNMMDTIAKDVKGVLPFVPNVDWKYYFEMERLDLACMVVAREGNGLVGYAGFILSSDPNTSTVQACVTSLFVHPDHRKFGTARDLIRASEKELRNMGVHLASFLVNPERDYSMLLRREGYREGMTVYLKSL